MCQAKANGGKRCAHDVYGVKLRNLQAKKQYHIRALKNAGGAAHQNLILDISLKVDKLKSLKKQIVGNITDFDIAIPNNASRVLTQLHDDGMQGFIVGGIVRDALLNLESKDIDIEVYGGTPERVITSLKKIGHVDEVGKAFGVLKIRIGSDDFDISLPRTEKKTGSSHQSFSVDVDPYMSLEEATSRRDFSINTLLYDDDLKIIIDCHGGLADLKAKQLRHVSDAFDEDPLRVLRGVQMSARFGMTMHPDTILKAKALKPEFGLISKERVQIEFQKMYEKGQDITSGYEVLAETSWDEEIPGLKEANTEDMRANLKKIQNNTLYRSLTQENKVTLLSSVVGNAVELKRRRDFLSYTTVGDKIKNTAYNLTVTPGPTGLSDYELKTWAHTIPKNMNSEMWCIFNEHLDEENSLKVLSKAKTLGILHNPEPDVVNGDDLLMLFPEKNPGPWIRSVLNDSRDNQYKNPLKTKEELLADILK